MLAVVKTRSHNHEKETLEELENGGMSRNMGRTRINGGGNENNESMLR
jgi:hypothetical protein